MKLSSINVPIYGDTGFRGNCPKEGIEQATAIARIRRKWPYSHGLLVLHPRNEGKRRYDQAAKHRAEGMTAGASDIIIPARVPFVCEVKRRDHTKSAITQEQIDYLNAARLAGCFSCVALGADAVMQALSDWLIGDTQ